MLGPDLAIETVDDESSGQEKRDVKGAKYVVYKLNQQEQQEEVTTEDDGGEIVDITIITAFKLLRTI